MPEPLYDEAVPIACTIGRGEIPDRIELIERLRTNIRRLERTEHGLVLHFPNRDDVAADVRRFAVDEKQCCQFWGFAVEPTGDDLTLRWDAPPAASGLLTRIEAYLSGDEPLTAISDLL